MLIGGKCYNILSTSLLGLDFDVKGVVEILRHDIQKFGRFLSAHCDTRGPSVCLVGDGMSQMLLICDVFHRFF